MDLKTKGRIVAIVETVFTVTTGFFVLLAILVAANSAAIFQAAILDVQKHQVPNNYSRTSYDKNTGLNFSSTDVNTAAAIASASCLMSAIVGGIIFGVSLVLLVLLWKAVNNKNHALCLGWWIAQSVFTALSLLMLIISWFGVGNVDVSWFWYLFYVPFYVFRVWSIHTVKSLGDELLRNKHRVAGNGVVKV